MNLLKKWTIPNALPYILIVSAIVGLFGAFSLSYDQIKIIQNPNYKPICDLNPIVSCGNVMQSKEGSALGIPNPYIGLATFGSLLTIGVAILAGATFKRWFWIGLEFGTILGIGFVHWLFF
jgi:Predicted membrane protein